MIETLLTSSVLILALAALRRVLRGRIDPRLQYALWLLVVLRLLIPGSLFPAPVTVSGALSAWEETWSQRGEADSAAPSSQPDQAGEGLSVLPVWGTLYDVYTEEEDFPLDTSPDQWLQEAPSEDYTVNGVEVDLEQGKQTVTYSRYASIWDMPFWRWPLYAGTALVGAVLLVSNLTFALSLRRRRRPVPAERLPGSCGCRVYLVEGLPSPCLAGLLRPAIYVNEAALAPGRLEHILVHEETHRRHGDHLWGLVRGLCLALYWYDPLVWWAASLSRRDCELACDHSAIRRLGEERRLDYGQTLVSMIAPGRPLSGLLRTATTMSEGKRTMWERVALIAHRPRMLKITLAAVVLAVSLVVVLTFGGAWEDTRADAGAADDPSGTGVIEDAAGTGSVQPAPGITETEALALYHEARTAWDWFEIGSLPTTEEVLETEEGSYLRAEGFDSLAELEDYLLTLFSPELTSYLLTGYQSFQETAEGLYVLPAGRGTSIYAGEEDVQAFVYTEAEAEQYGYDGHIYAAAGVLDAYDLTTVLYQKRHDWSFAWNGANYVFTSFGPWDDGDPQIYYNALTILDHYQRGNTAVTWLPMLRDLDWNALLATRDQWPEGFDLGLYVLDSLSQYITEQGGDMTAVQYRNILSATEGLDGAYAEGFSYEVWRLYENDPRQFAQVVLEELTAAQRAQILDYFRHEEASRRDSGDSGPMTAEEALAFLRRLLGAVTLTSTAYDHTSSLFSLSLPEEWAGAVVYVETEDGVDFYEAGTYAEAGYGWLLGVHPQPTSWVEDNAGEAFISLGSFDTNGTPHQYILEYRLSLDFSAEPAARSREDQFRALLAQRDQIGFRLSVTSGLIDSLVHDSYGSDMAGAIPYLPYLSWSSYRDTYGESDMFSLLSALREYAGSGQADWDQIHDILSLPAEGLDGAYATAYQDILWSLYQAAPEALASVLRSVYLTDTERDNAVYWLRAPLAWAEGLTEPLSDAEVRQRLELGGDGAAGSQEAETAAGTDLTDGEAMNGIMRGYGPSVMGEGSPETLTVDLAGNWSLEGIRQAIFDALTGYTAGSSLEGDLAEVSISYSFQLPSALRAGTVLTVPYTATYRGSAYTLPSGAAYAPVASTGELTAAVRLTGQGSAEPADGDFAAGQAAYQQLSACAQLPAVTVSASDEAFDVAAYLQGAIASNLTAAGLGGSYRIASLTTGGYTAPHTMAPGSIQSITFSVSFAPLTEDGYSGITVDAQLTVRTAE